MDSPLFISSFSFSAHNFCKRNYFSEGVVWRCLLRQKISIHPGSTNHDAGDYIFLDLDLYSDVTCVKTYFDNNLKIKVCFIFEMDLK